MFFYKLVKIGEIIRSRETRSCFLIVEKQGENLFVVNLMDATPVPGLQVVLPKAQENFDRDIEIVDLEKWEADCLANRVPETVKYADDFATI